VRDALPRDRPEQYGAAAWVLILSLDMLPWPWGERLLALTFVLKACVQVSCLRQALRWAGAQSLSGARRWRLAMALLAHHGRALARSAIVGLRSPEAWRPYVKIRGEEHLRSARGGAILLGFHVGMPGSDIALRVAGQHVRWLGGNRVSRGWSRPAWRPLVDGDDELEIDAGPLGGGVLRRACRVLLAGEHVYLTADGGVGREAFRVPLPGGPLVVRAGWLALRTHTQAPVLPVLSHREGPTHVVTIHPPLPADLVSCEMILGRLFEDYTRRFPEQCYTLAFPPPGGTTALAA